MKKFYKFILTNVSVILFIIKADAAELAQEQNITYVEWWEMAVFFTAPSLIWCYFIILSADSSGREGIKKSAAIFMQITGSIMIIISLITSYSFISYPSAAIGLLYILIAQWFLSLKKRFSAHARSIRELPVTAQRLGLQYIESNVINQPGRMEGIYKNFHVRVDPNGGSNGRFEVKFPEKIGGCLITFDAPRYKPSDGMIEFNTGNHLFDEKFKTRYAHAGLALRMQNPGTRLDPVLSFAQRWGRGKWWSLGLLGRGWIEINGKGIIYSDVPYKGGPYALTARRVEEILPGLIAMAEAFDEIIH